MKTKYSFHPKKYALGQMEKYYSDMAANGWHLKKRGLWLSKFSQGEKEDIKYRVELISPKSFSVGEMPREQMAVWEDCGWQFVDSDSYVYIFRAPVDSDTEEFYVDPSQQADTLKGLRRDMLFSALHVPVSITAFWVLGMMFGENNFAALYLAWLAETAGVIGLFSLLGRFCVDGAAGTVHLGRLYRRMKKGIPLDHNPKRTGRTATLITFLLIAIGFAGIGNVYMNKPYPMPYNSDGDYITFRDAGIYGEQTDFMGKECTVTHSVSPFAEYWDTFENISGDGSKWMYQEIMVLKDKSRRENVVKAFIETATFAREEKLFKEIDVPGMDRVLFTGGLECIAVKGNRVAYITSIFDSQHQLEMTVSALADRWENA